MLLSIIHSTLPPGAIDFCYLRMDFANRCNVGESRHLHLSPPLTADRLTRDPSRLRLRQLLVDRAPAALCARKDGTQVELVCERQGPPALVCQHPVQVRPSPPAPKSASRCRCPDPDSPPGFDSPRQALVRKFQNSAVMLQPEEYRVSGSSWRPRRSVGRPLTRCRAASDPAPARHLPVSPRARVSLPLISPR